MIKENPAKDCSFVRGRSYCFLKTPPRRGANKFLSIGSSRILSTNPVHAGTADWTFSLQCWFTVLHGNPLRVRVVPFASALHTIHRCHVVISPPFLPSLQENKKYEFYSNKKANDNYRFGKISEQIGVACQKLSCLGLRRSEQQLPAPIGINLLLASASLFAHRKLRPRLHY